MTGDWQVRDEERTRIAPRVNPLQDARNGRRLVDAEARMVVATDVACIFEQVVAAIRDHRFHSEVHETAGMKQRGGVAETGKLATALFHSGRFMYLGMES